MLNNPYLVALGIPLTLLICGAIAKKIARGEGWKRTDFFLGLELALATMGSAMLHFYDLQKMNVEQGDPAMIGAKIGASATFLVAAFVVLLWVLSTHQDWERRTANTGRQIIWLGIVSNIAGVAMFAGFVLFVKGV